ncbi:MAG: alpha amylase C-terminal domain-containing protein [Verrucomicrobia bacterium]|nr:alpha amylase C-terminal domain-containing protein [Verrucomicrobiota bacterium]
MIRTEYADLARDVRKWGLLGNEDMRVVRLAELERRIPFLSDSYDLKAERVSLIQDLALERHKNIFKSIHSPSLPSDSVRAFEDKVAMLKLLGDLLKKEPGSVNCKKIFNELPEDVKSLFYWAVWVDAGVPRESQCGEKRLSKGFAPLLVKTVPILNVNGGSLCEQALAHFESLLVLERQKQTLSLLLSLGEQLPNVFVDLQKMKTIILQLPAAIQYSMYMSVTSFFPLWGTYASNGKSNLMANPKLLLTARRGGPKGPLELDSHLDAQHAILQNLIKASEIEEVERLTLLSKSASRAQLDAVLGKVSKKAQSIYCAIEKDSLRQVELRSDTRHLYQWRGAHPKCNGTHFEVFAPAAKNVILRLTAFGTVEHNIPMTRNQYGVWEVFTEHARLGRTYRYLIEDCHGKWSERTDPFGFAVHEDKGIAESVVCQMDGFQWNDGEWLKNRGEGNPILKPLSIYEMNVDFWKKKDGATLTFQELAHFIVQHHKNVPFTHVELYGVLDNKHDWSWGYQPDHFFVPNRRMGGPEGFKTLVDILHQNKIGVILDWIPTHYKNDHAGDLSQSLHNYDGTNLFAAEESPWQTVYFDYGKEETRRLMMASAHYWLEKMHVDGLRVDAVGPMVRRNGHTQKHAVDFLKELNRSAHQQYPGVLMIAEETDGFPNVTRPVDEGGLGFDVKVGVHMQYRTRSYFRTPYQHRSSSEHHHGKLLSNLGEVGGHERWMLAHSHDDAAVGSPHRHSTLYRGMPTEDTWRKFADIRLFHAWNLFSPGVGHMIHMGDEIGQDWPWNERLTAQEGAVEWHLLDKECPETSFRRGLLKYVGDMNRLYRSKPAFWKHADWGYRPISDHAQNCVVGYHRLDFQGGRLALFYNFSTKGYDKYDFPMPSIQSDPELGYVQRAREIFNSDSVEYGGTGKFKTPWATILRNERGAPTHFRIALPPLSVVVFEETWD